MKLTLPKIFFAIFIFFLLFFFPANSNKTQAVTNDFCLTKTACWTDTCDTYPADTSSYYGGFCSNGTFDPYCTSGTPNWAFNYPSCGQIDFPCTQREWIDGLCAQGTTTCTWQQQSCSTADSCTSAQPYLNPGLCQPQNWDNVPANASKACQIGSTIYKTCCNSNGTVDGWCTGEDYTGTCPSGTVTQFCGFGSYPPCGAAACAPLAPPATPTPIPPTPTPLPSYTCSISSSSTGTETGTATVTESNNFSRYDRTNWFLNGSSLGTNSNLSYNFTGLSPNTTYAASATRWSSSNLGPSTSCGLTTFTTSALNCPTSPPSNSSLSPNGTTFPAGTTSVTLSWSAVANADWYDVRVDDGNSLVSSASGPIANNCGGGHDVCINQWSSTSMIITVTSGNSYTWWVHAGGQDQTGTLCSQTNSSGDATFGIGILAPTLAPTVGPTPVLGCVSCGTNAQCGGNPPTFPANCPSCSGSWVYQSAGDSTCTNAAQGSLYPYCWVCTAPLPTATPGPSGAPTPTPTIPSCNNPAKISGSSCTVGVDAPSFWTNVRCGSSCCLNQQCQPRSETEDPNDGFWTNCTTPNSCGGAVPTAPPTSTVSGIVFIDRNDDNNRDEDGLDNIAGTIDDEILYSGGARLYLNTQSTTTNDSGAYQFTGVTSGSYTLELDVPFGFSPNKSTGYDTSTNTNKLTFTIPPPASAADFGIVPYEVGVGGTMYTTLDDSCSTSITNQGRLGSKSLSLSENYFGLSYSTATNSNGAYSFSYPNQTLFPGSYSITPSDVSGARLICALVYADDGSATAVSVRSTPFTYGDDPGENLTLTTAQPQKRVDFYYQLVQPWIQGKGADMRIDSGFNDPVSASSRDPYAMLSNGRSPGVIFSGGNSYSFCVSASSGICLERSSEDPMKRWVVGGTIYPETFTPAIPGTTRTSYSYLLGLAKQKGKTITEIPDSIDGRNCYDAPGCNLAALDPDPDVVYTNQPGRDVYTRSSGITFNRGDYVFLIKGNLHIQGEIQTVSTPNASTLVVSVSGDITVDADVGGSSSSSPTHIKGLFSADSDFVLESNGTQGSNCPSDRDKRLNMQGAVVANAALDPLNPGTFQNNRTLCNDNSDYPVFYIEEQPEFILNFPDFLKHKSFVWQEVAP